MYRCDKCEKQFRGMVHCCKELTKTKTALGMSLEETKKMIDESNIEIYDLFFEMREDIELKQLLINRMKKSIKASVRELNLLEYKL